MGSPRRRLVRELLIEFGTPTCAGSVSDRVPFLFVPLFHDRDVGEGSSNASSSFGVPPSSQTPVIRASTTLPVTTVYNSSKTTSPTGVPPATNTKRDSNGNPTSSKSSLAGAIAGGAAVLIGVISGLLFWGRRTWNHRRFTQGTHEPHQSCDFYIDGPLGTPPRMLKAPSGGVVPSDAGAIQSLNSPTPPIMSPPQVQALEVHAPPYDDMPSPVPESDPPNPAPQNVLPSRFNNNLRHTDAGAIIDIPLSRSSSGRLPPAYLSWEDNVSVRSSAPIPQQESAIPPGAHADDDLDLPPGPEEGEGERRPAQRRREEEKTTPR